MNGLTWKRSRQWLAVVALSVGACATSPERRGPAQTDRNVIVVVWDGLRPDTIDAALTPNLARVREAGTEFTDNHSTYPTFTMMNAASFATGSYSGSTGYYGNEVWQPGSTGKEFAAQPVPFPH